MQATTPEASDLLHSDKLAVGEPLPVMIGDEIAGKYTVDSIIGIGGRREGHSEGRLEFLEQTRFERTLV